MNRPLTILTALFLVAFTGMSQRYSVSPESTMQIAGGSSMHDWTCDVVSEGWMDSDGDAATAPASVEITAAVDEIECGKGVMNRKLRGALKADDHPQIVFKSTELERNGDGSLAVSGTLSAAGSSKPISVTLEQGSSESGDPRYTGSFDLLMSDFGISPPTAMLGAMKTHDAVTVSFSIVMTPSN